MSRALPFQPHDDEGPVFAEPWQAQAFALAVRLADEGLFTWDEWAAALSAEIARAQEAGDPDLGNTYYQHWLRAL
jgi:nitrile hydratase accessory protein